MPSSLITSHTTPAGGSPASLARSTAASVCPRLRSTPPSEYLSGNTWPGRTMSSGPVVPLASSWMVLARSAAEMPVVMPFLASTLIVNAVPWCSWFWLVICGRCSRSRSGPSIGTQISPRA